MIPFEDFWKLIPSQRKELKKRAVAVWDDMTDAQRAKAIKMVPAALARAGEPHFFPVPFRWLRDERYDDECLEAFRITPSVPSDFR